MKNSKENTNYQVLMKDLNGKDEVELFKIVNWRIDEMLSSAPDKVEMLKALICAFEGRNNNTAYYAIISLAYAIVLGCYNIFANIFNVKLIISTVLFLAVAAAVVIYAARIEYKAGRNRTFLLNALKFKYEKINDEIVNNEKETCTEDEKEKQYVVKVKLKNQGKSTCQKCNVLLLIDKLLK